MNSNYLKFVLKAVLILLSAATLNAQSIDHYKKSEKSLKDKPLKIKSRNAPNENVINECKLPQGTSLIYVGVLATFDSSGQVTDAKIAGSYSSCQAFDEECLKVTRKIKFTPEIKNGVPVTVVKPITYQINITSGSR